MRSPWKFPHAFALVWLALSFTPASPAWAQDRAPVVTVPASMNAAENQLLTFTAAATDPDGDAIASFTYSSSPTSFGGTFTSGVGNTSGTFSWTPSFTQAGSYTLTFTAVNALSGSAATAVSVANTDRAPVLFAGAAFRSAAEGVNLNFTVTASDPDGDAIATLTASSSPATTGSTFTVNATNTSGTFDWTPPAGSGGSSYVVTFTAANALSRSATTTISVGDRPPVVTAPATMNIPENSPVTFTVTATDPDGDAITSLTSASSPATPGSSFTTNPTNTSGTFNWATSVTSAGVYTVTFTASNALSGSAQTNILVCNGCSRAPVVTAPATATFPPNTLGTIPVSATDPDADAITSLTSSSSPATTGSQFTVSASNTSGTFSWTPTFGQVGTYTVTFTASNVLSGSAATALTVAGGGDRAPVVTAPATQAVGEGKLLLFTVSATDPDGDAIASLASSSSPATSGSTFTANATRTSGTFSWVPSFTQAGSYTVTFTASNALSGSAATTIVICNGCGDSSPTVIAPISVNGPPNTLITFQVSAIDVDGQPITFLTASGPAIDAGGTFTKNASNTSGTFSWTPTVTQTSSVTFTATNAISGSAMTTIYVCDGCDRAPAVTAPATQAASLNVPMSFVVLASDPDGQAITSLTASGSPMTYLATFTTNAASTSGTFSWTPPGNLPHGTYLVTFTASNALSGAATTYITVGGDRAPVVNAPAAVQASPGILLTFGVSANDPDGDAIASLTASSSPATTGSTFTDNGQHTSGTFSWTPTLAQSGSYTVTFTASNALPGSASTVITIGGDRAPVVTAPAIVSRPDFSPITFTVTASSPDGDPLASLTASSAPPTTGSSFVAGAGNTSGTFQWAPTTAQAGQYTVTFTVTENGPGHLQGLATTQITVGQTMPARAFATNNSKTIRLNSGKPQWCAHVEPISGFQLSDILLGSVVLRSPGTGSVSEIPAITGKANVQGDADNNGIDDGEFCFAKGNLQLLFSNLNGHNSVNVTIAGRLSSGLFFEGTLSVDVNAGGGGNPAASITPNPLNPSGVLTFDTARSGGVRVRIFDSGGRLVRTVLDTALPAGPHEVRFDAKTASGTALASGVYYFRVEALGDVMTGRFVVAK